jgi:hypothetical protein
MKWVDNFYKTQKVEETLQSVQSELLDFVKNLFLQSEENFADKDFTKLT